MATEIQINPLDFDTDIGVGLKTSFISDSKSFFGLNYTTFDQIKDNLINLLNTNKGERLMQPEFGCDLRKMVFEQDVIVVPKIQNEVESCIGFWMPYLIIDTFDIVTEENSVFVTLQFHVEYNESQQGEIQLIID